MLFRSPGSLQNAVVSAFDLVQTEFGQFEQEPAGSSTSKSTVARPALTAFRASRLYPVVVVTRIDRDYPLRNWKTASITLASVALPVLLGLTLLSLAYYRRQMLQAAQREESARLKAINATVFDSSTEATLITGVDEAIVSINAAFTRVTGYAANDIIGRHLDELLVPESPGEANGQSQQGGETSRAEPPTVEVQLRCKDGSHLWMEILSTPERDAAGRIVGYRRIGRNITERREMQDRVRELAFHDPLTGLPNRLAFETQLSQAIADCDRQGKQLALMLIDGSALRQRGRTFLTFVAFVGGSALVWIGYDYSQQYSRNRNEQSDNSPMDLKDWILTLIVLLIPCVGIVMYFVWAFESNGNINRRNFCRAQLIIFAVLLGIYLVLFMLFGVVAFSQVVGY